MNAENAGHRCEKFMQMAIRTRSAYLQELATQHITQQTVDAGSGSGLGEGVHIGLTSINVICIMQVFVAPYCIAAVAVNVK